MKSHDLKQLSGILQAERLRLLDLLGRTSKHLYRREEPYDADFAEQAVETENDQVVETLDHNAKLELRQIDDALKRIDANSYGVCLRCGEQIGPQRLRAIPHTEHCVACVENSDA